MSHCLCNTNSVTRRLIKSHNESLFVQHKQTALQEDWTRVIMSHCLCNLKQTALQEEWTRVMMSQCLCNTNEQHYKKNGQGS